MSRVRRDKNSAQKNWALAFVTISVFCIVFFAARDRFQVPILRFIRTQGVVTRLSRMSQQYLTAPMFHPSNRLKQQTRLVRRVSETDAGIQNNILQFKGVMFHVFFIR